MNPEPNWADVVTALKIKTESRRVPWQEGRLPAGLQDLVTSALGRGNQARSFVAKVGKTSYELSAGDPFGRGPYELKIWEERSGDRRAITALNSKLSAHSTNRLTSSLEELYRTVDNIVEREEETASRLLTELENL
jgi:hypothetical protein